jgi:hypothetical protein
MRIPLETHAEINREMLLNSHFSTRCYQHNIGFRGGTMVFFKRFQQWKFVFQGGAEGARNALFGGKKWAASVALQAHGLISKRRKRWSRIPGRNRV